MLQNTIENTSIRVSKLAFGTGSLHHVFSLKQRQRLLSTALEEGIEAMAYLILHMAKVK